MKHLFHRKKLFFASELSGHASMGQDDVDGRTDIQAEVRGYKDEPVAEAAHNLRDTAIFRAEYIDGIVRVLELGQASRSGMNLDTHRCDIQREEIEWPIRTGPVNGFVAFHAFFPGQTLELIDLHARAGPYQRVNSEARTRSNSPAYIVRELGVDHDYTGGFELGYHRFSSFR
jgi:hypothetical protein